MEIIRANDEAGRDAAFSLLMERREGVVVNITEKTWCICGSGFDCNKQFCDDNGIEVFRTHHSGGTIIVFPGDLSMYAIQRERNKLGKRITERVRQYLLDAGINAVIDGNDVMADGRKVCSYGSSVVNGLLETVVHVSSIRMWSLSRKYAAKKCLKCQALLATTELRHRTSGGR